MSDGTIQINGKCLDIADAGTANGSLIDISGCDGGASQQWAAENEELVHPASGRCPDDPNSSTTNGTQLDIWDCSGGASQQWAVLGDPPVTFTNPGRGPVSPHE